MYLSQVQPLEWPKLQVRHGPRAKVAQALVRTSAFFGIENFKKVLRFADRIAPDSDAVIRVSQGTVFSFPLKDRYWWKKLFFDVKNSAPLDQRYEGDIADFLLRIANVEYTFIDCGANFGWWSVLVSGERFGGQDVIAIEPSASNFAILMSNRHLNQVRFQAINRAVYSAGGMELQLYGRRHAGFSLTNRQDEAAAGKVITTTLDEVFDDHSVSQPLVVKLDIEGAERDALHGARKILELGAMVIFEDDRDDPESVVASWFFDRGLRVYRMRIGALPVRVYSPEAVSALKSDGLSNFIGVNESSPWIDLLDGVGSKVSHRIFA